MDDLIELLETLANGLDGAHRDKDGYVRLTNALARTISARCRQQAERLKKTSTADTNAV